MTKRDPIPSGVFLSMPKVKALVDFLYKDLGVHSVEEDEPTTRGQRYTVDIGYDNDFETVRAYLLLQARNLGFQIAATTDPDDDLGFTIWLP